MPVAQIVNEALLDHWVRAHPDEAQKKIVELVWRLVCVSCPKPNHRHFPLDIAQHGADGILETSSDYLPFIPAGKSIWEIGTGVNAKNKANTDYIDSINSTPEEVRKESSFIFVTPLSGRRDWKDTWKTDGIETWIDEKNKLKQWKDVRVIDGCQLIDWVSHFPVIGHWLSTIVNQMPEDFDTAENYWQLISSYGAPPSLLPDIFTIGRDSAIDKLRRLIIEQEGLQLRFETRYPSYTKSFVSAFLASLPETERLEHQSRVLILTSKEAFKQACSLRNFHILIADFDVDSNSGHELIQRAVSKRHTVIYSAFPGGGPLHGNNCELCTPKVHEMKEALIKSGYSEERARTLTNQSGRDLNSLLRLILGLSAMPGWATQSEASDLAIAHLIGQWQEACEGDQEAIEELSGKPYGEWMINIRKIASVESAPLESFNGHWKFTSRYEPWLYLGKLIGPEILDRFERLAIKILSEPDPSLALPKEKRHAVSIYGQKPKYSSQLLKGISETLALLGSHGASISNCPHGKPELVAKNVVNTLLEKADAEKWASLNHHLPLLAEAAPDVFLKAVGGANEHSENPFSGVFAEEGSGFLGGGSYTTGLLWALESLAWSDDYLIRACGILANLAAIDPGGQLLNRPSNSLYTILLPWLPQTTANIERRHAAAKLIVREQPDVAWELIQRLLPQPHSSSSYTYKPKWRDFIPENWKDGVSDVERAKDEAFYADIALELAGKEPKRLEMLLEHYFFLNPNFSNFAEKYRERLQTDEILSLDQDQRFILWSALKVKTSNHRKYAGSENWAVAEEKLQELDDIAEKIKPETPSIIHKRLFITREFELYEEKGDWENQKQILLQKRVAAIKEILNQEGIECLRAFWQSVESPEKVGDAFGSDPELENDGYVLPAMLESGYRHDFQFAVSYIWRRFCKGEWNWVDSINRSGWSIDSKAHFFSTLPFVNEVWIRVYSELGDSSSAYWLRARAFPDKKHLENIDFAINQLIENGRSDEAISCLEFGELSGCKFDELRLSALEDLNDKNHIDTHAIGETFRHLQQNSAIDRGRLAILEIKFLELLDRFGSARPQTLFQNLSEQPEFFCEVIQLIYRSKNEPDHSFEEVLDENDNKVILANKAYRLLLNWDQLPGIKPDGSFDKKFFQNWMDETKKLCLESGHWEVATHQIGEVLYYAPKDENDLWIEPVCEVLDTKGEVRFLHGLRMRIFNSRGVHGFSEGKAEIELAEKWEKIATHAENKGFARLGETLRTLGKSYRRDAEMDVLEHRHEGD